MGFSETIRDAIAMMRRRMSEIDGLIERMERGRTCVHEIRKKKAPASRQLYGKRRRSSS